ncbi:MAG TPA: pyridoxamine 5'-phosphate oxidase [Myxococcota bacterium]|nr:pyridoxamine 5'-phosphate oxidase [Myxococcota bacterium]
MDALGRPRSRILHPIWEGSTGWIATGRRSFKAKHIEDIPYVSLSYWDPQHEQVYVDCGAEWEERTQEKQRIWQLFHSTPPPLGYDLAQFFGAPDDPSYGLLRLSPWRVELWSLQDLTKGRPPRVWRPPPS